MKQILYLIRIVKKVLKVYLKKVIKIINNKTFKHFIMMKNQINKVNVEKASANAKASSLIALDVLKSVKAKNAGLFKTSLGTKTEIYKKELFEGANEKQIKSLRKKFRNVAFNFLSTIANNADKKLIEGFIDFYKQVYVTNDFSFSSIASENTKEEKKAILIKGLEIVKKSMK